MMVYGYILAASSCGCGAFENCTSLGPEARRSLLTLKFSNLSALVQPRSRRDGMMVYRYSNSFYRPSTEYSVNTSVLEILIFNLWVLWNHSTSSLYIYYVQYLQIQVQIMKVEKKNHQICEYQLDARVPIPTLTLSSRYIRVQMTSTYVYTSHFSVLGI